MAVNKNPNPNYNPIYLDEGDIITNDYVDQVQDQLKQIVDNIPSIVQVGGTNIPTNGYNQLWIKENTDNDINNNSIQVPQLTEFNELKYSLAKEYESGQQYKIGDYVIHYNKIYRCIRNIPISGIWNDDYWAQAEIANDLGHHINNITQEKYEIGLNVLSGLNYQAGYMNDTGNITSPTSINQYMTYDPIEVQTGQKFIVKLKTKGTAWLGVTFWDKEQMNFLPPRLSYSDSTSIIQGSYHIIQKKIEVPTDAKYVRISIRTNGNYTATLNRIDSIVTSYNRLNILAEDYEVKPYKVGDYAFYENELYKCIVKIEAGESWTAAHWQTTNLQKEQQLLNNTLDSRFWNIIAPQYSEERTYKVNDYVIYDNCLYRCISDVIYKGIFNTSKWKRIIVGNEIYNFEKDLIVAQKDQPNLEHNRLWIPTDEKVEVEIPTYDEFNQLSKETALADTNILKTMREIGEWTSLEYNTVDGCGINVATGNEGISGNYNCTDYINVLGYDYIRYKRIFRTITATDYGVVFYDENKARVSGAYAIMNASSNRYENSMMRVPEGAMYLRCTMLNDVTTYGAFEVLGHNALKKQADANANNLENVNGLLYDAITNPRLIPGGWTSGGLDFVNGSTTANAAYIKTGYISVLAGSTVEALDGYKFNVVLYTDDDNHTYIDGKSAVDYRKYVVPVNCKIRLAISTVNGDTQVDDSIADNLVIHLYTPQNSLRQYATVTDLNYATKYYVDPTTLRTGYGGLFTTGHNNQTTTRLRILPESGSGAIRVGKGSVVSVADGFKFNMAMYSEYISNSNFTLLDFVRLRTEPYVVQDDCYVRIAVGTLDDAELWYEDSDGAVTLTEDGEAARAGVQLELIGSTVKNEIENLKAAQDAEYWDKMIPLESEIPLNALEYHARFDDLVTAGKLSRTLLGYAKNENGVTDEDLPIYLYVLRNDMNHIDPNYGIVQWNGNNELYNRPSIFLDSGIHGNERTTPYVLLDFIEKLCGNIQYQDMRNTFDWYFIPLVNPWGFGHTAKLISSGAIDNGKGYTSTNKANYKILDNTSSIHQGVRCNAAGIDINRDFGEYATEEARIFRDALISLSSSVGQFIFSIDSHQAARGDQINLIGCFLSLAPGATDEMNRFVWTKWMQAGAKTEQILAEHYDREVKQGVYPWDGTSITTTIRGFMMAYTTYSMCLEGGQTMVYYSQDKTWSNKTVRNFINTQYHGFMHRLVKHWM